MTDFGITLKDGGTFRPTYSLDPNSVQGFQTAVNNGQTRLALEYAVNVLKDMQAQIDGLNKRLDKSEPTPKQAVAKKPAAKKEEVVENPSAES